MTNSLDGLKKQHPCIEGVLKVYADAGPDGCSQRERAIVALANALQHHEAELAKAQETIQQQARGLQEMEARKDAAYLERNQVVAALAACFPSGVARTAIEGWSEDWHSCIYVDLPTGQASWHFHDSQAHLFEGFPAYSKEWDGHTTEEKYERLSAFARHSARAQQESEAKEE